MSYCRFTDPPHGLYAWMEGTDDTESTLALWFNADVGSLKLTIQEVEQLHAVCTEFLADIEEEKANETPI